MLLRMCLVLLAVCLSTAAWAQTVAVSYDLIIYTPGSPTPQTRNVLASGVACDQAPPTATTMTNPTTWYWDDPARSGRVCKVDDTIRITALADGSYNGTVIPVAADGTRGVESASSPFSRLRILPPLPARTGVKIIR
jgi:hypothetical protein